MKLRIATPTSVAVDAEATAIRAADETGEFGIMAGHADFLTILSISVLSWTEPDGQRRHAAVKGGVLTVERGSNVAVSTREAVVSDDLDTLADTVLARFRADEEAERAEHAEETRLHLAAIRAVLAGLSRADRGARW